VAQAVSPPERRWSGRPDNHLWDHPRTRFESRFGHNGGLWHSVLSRAARVASIETLAALNLHYPKVRNEKLKELATAKRMLIGSKE
jgi:hypothetical protein